MREPAASVPSRKPTSDSNCSRLAQSPAGPIAPPPAQPPHRPLHHRYQPARRAGLHRPRRKVRHNGCRDRRSRWPPPWSTLDMSNADFDTRHTSPRARPATAKPRPGHRNPSKTRPEHAQPRNPATHHQPTAPTRQPAILRDSPKPPYLRAIHCQFSPPRGSLQKSRTRLQDPA